jgi:hypothetical protein
MKIFEEVCGCTTRDFTGNYPICPNQTCRWSKDVLRRFINDETLCNEQQQLLMNYFCS